MKPRNERGEAVGFPLHAARTVTCVAIAPDERLRIRCRCAGARPRRRRRRRPRRAPAAAPRRSAPRLRPRAAPASAAASSPSLPPAPAVAAPRARAGAALAQVGAGADQPIPTSSCAPARAAAIRSSSSRRATSGSRSSCATPTGSASAPTDGKVGWVSRQQLETTLTAAGGTKSFRDVLLDDYLSRKVQLGAAWGHFKSEPMLKLWTSYRLSDTLSLEATIGQVQGVFSGTDLWHVNLLIEPWSDHRISPFFGVGVGKFKNFPNLSLIGATDHQRQARRRARRRSLLPHRALRPERRLLALHRLRQRPADRPNTAPGPLGLSFFF